MDLTFRVQDQYTFVDEGQGPAVILLHGLLGGPENFEAVLPELREDYRVIVPRLPLFALPLHRTTVRDLIRFLHQFVSDLRLERFSLVGNSLGGHIALLYTLERPGAVDGMVLAGSSGLWENTFGTTLPRRKDYEYVREKAALTFYDPALATKELVDEVFGILNSNVSALKLLRMAKSAARENLADELHRLSLPVGLIWGFDDVVTPPEVAREFHAKLPMSRLAFLRKCGHAPMLEKPRAFSRLLREHLHWISQTAGETSGQSIGEVPEIAPAGEGISAVAMA